MAVSLDLQNTTGWVELARSQFTEAFLGYDSDVCSGIDFKVTGFSIQLECDVPSLITFGMYCSEELIIFHSVNDSCTATNCLVVSFLFAFVAGSVSGWTFAFGMGWQLSTSSTWSFLLLTFWWSVKIWLCPLTASITLTGSSVCWLVYSFHRFRDASYNR